MAVKASRIYEALEIVKMTAEMECTNPAHRATCRSMQRSKERMCPPCRAKALLAETDA